MGEEARALEVVEDVELKNVETLAQCEQISDKVAVLEAELKEKELEAARQKRVFNVAHPVANFHGRRQELEDIRESLESGGGCITLSSISGLGGIGKTQLARKFAHRYFCEEDCNAVWIDAETVDDLTESFHKVAKGMKISVGQPEDEEPQWGNESVNNSRSLKDIAYDVYNALSTRKTLLIFDNVNTYDDVREHMPWTLMPNRSPVPQVLITSRNMSWDGGSSAEINVIELHGFTKDEAAEYVIDVLKLRSVDELMKRDIDSLTELLGYLPLALSQAVAYIKLAQAKNKGFGIRDYIDKFEKNKVDLYDFKMKYDKYKFTVYSTWRITFDAIQREGEVGAKALELISTMVFLAPHYILVEAFFLQGLDEGQLWDAVDLLENYAITNTAEGVASVHRLVRDVVQLWIKERGETELYLEQVLKIEYLWDYEHLIWNKMMLTHFMTFLEEACNYGTIVGKLFQKDENIRESILRFLADKDLKAVVENLFDTLTVPKRYREYTLTRAASSGAEQVTEYLSHNDPNYMFPMRVFSALKKREYGKLRSYLGANAENCSSLINMGFYYKASNEFGATNTALGHSIRRNDLEAVKLLVDFGVEINGLPQWGWGLPFVIACRAGHIEIVKYLIAVASERGQILAGRESAFCEALRSEKKETALLLIETGLDVNYSDRYDKTALHYASEVGYTDFVLLLLEKGAFVNVLDKNKKSPLYHAVIGNYPPTVHCLLDHGALLKVSEEDESEPFHISAGRGYSKILKLFSEHKMDCNIRNKYGHTPLHFAADFGTLDCAKMLVEVGADINIQDNKGFLPIDYAHISKNVDVVEFLRDLPGSVWREGRNIPETDKISENCRTPRGFDHMFLGFLPDLNRHPEDLIVDNLRSAGMDERDITRNCELAKDMELMPQGDYSVFSGMHYSDFF